VYRKLELDARIPYVRYLAFGAAQRLAFLAAGDLLHGETLRLALRVAADKNVSFWAYLNNGAQYIRS